MKKIYILIFKAMSLEINNWEERFEKNNNWVNLELLEAVRDWIQEIIIPRWLKNWYFGSKWWSVIVKTWWTQNTFSYLGEVNEFFENYQS